MIPGGKTGGAPPDAIAFAAAIFAASICACRAAISALKSAIILASVIALASAAAVSSSSALGSDPDPHPFNVKNKLINFNN